MDFNILESLGKIAGIAGIGFGIIALIFGGIIQKKIFPKLDQKQGYSIIRTLIFLSFTIAILGLLSWTYTSISKEKKKTTKTLNIIGYVKNTEGSPAKGVKVYFKQDQNNFDKTDSEGKFVLEMKGVGAHFYDLILFHEDYNNYDKNVEINFSDPKGRVEFEPFELIPIKKRKVKEEDTKDEPERGASITLIYNGDNLGCLLDLSLNIAGKTVVPKSNQITMYDIPTGKQSYKIEGKINCGFSGSCLTSGSGKLFIKNNATYYIVWVNENLDGHCEIGLYTQDQMTL